MVLLLLRSRSLDPRRQQRLQHLPVVAVIEPNDPFFAARRHDAAVGADADRVDEIGVAAEVADVPAVVGVPEADRLVAAAGDELWRLADEEQARHLLAVSGDGADLLALLVVPHLD